MKRLVLLGGLSLVPYASAFYLQDLRTHTVEFEIAFFAAFALYSVAVVLVLRSDGSRVKLAMLFAFAILFRAILIFTPPTLSDDMYRYVWDGRVQANGINPYAHPPSATELQYLRDDAEWSQINRKDAVTVYPAGAEIAFALLWRVVPDSVRWVQIVMTLGDLLAGGLLILLLRALKLPDTHVLIYWWSPLVIFETAHAAHVDGMVLPLLIGAWLARVKGRAGWVGALLGLATAIKFYPILLAPALWRPRDELGRWRAAWQMPLAFIVAFAATYLPYLGQGVSVIGFLPNYFNERFNMGLAGIFTDLIEKPPAPIFAALSQAVNGSAPTLINFLLATTLIVISLVFILRPARTAEEAIRRCIFPIGAFTLLTQNLFPWYLLWLIPLLALCVQPGRLGLRLDAWTGWFLFSGLIALAYTFFIEWKPVTWALYLQFIPLYALVILPFSANKIRAWRPQPLGA